MPGSLRPSRLPQPQGGLGGAPSARTLAAPAENPSTPSTRASGRHADSTHRTPLLDGEGCPARRWLGRRWWRTGANREAKLLLLAHAFDTLGFTEVRWRVDAANTRSREAVTRLGARPADPGAPPHGLLHYTMTATDWPAARARLTG
ncbi:hypothetical protein GCM10009759_52560 [Kitasatospora saccharophila]|uniref:N-acetyltransferase domain-containing protein n=1 Tax=Kitasatospora saccharophila TaxID=407973 RepID=A0ABN2XEV0_9ACTN